MVLLLRPAQSSDAAGFTRELCHSGLASYGLYLAELVLGEGLVVPWSAIIKSRRDWDVVSNLPDYEVVYSRFSWKQAQQELEGLPGGQGLNIAHEAVDRHAEGPLT